MSKSATQVDREAGEGAFHPEPSSPAAEHVPAPVTVTDSETGEVFHAVPNKHGDTVIDFGDGTYAVHVGGEVYRECREVEDAL